MQRCGVCRKKVRGMGNRNWCRTWCHRRSVKQGRMSDGMNRCMHRKRGCIRGGTKGKGRLRKLRRMHRNRRGERIIRRKRGRSVKHTRSIGGNKTRSRERGKKKWKWCCHSISIGRGRYMWRRNASDSMRWRQDYCGSFALVHSSSESICIRSRGRKME